MERAFKTLLHCDVSKVNTAYLIMPKVTHCANNEHWSKEGARKNLYC